MSLRIGAPREIKASEHRVGLTPGLVERLAARGHAVNIEAGAGLGVGAADADYVRAGARILPDAASLFESSDLIVKVKEPLPAEVALLRPGHILFTYLHLAANAPLAAGLQRSGCTAIAYETVLDRAGRLPLLAPMSQVAGRMAVDVGAGQLLAPAGGRGMLLGGIPGVAPASVVILGGGVAGRHAADVALGHRADVTLFDISASVLAELDARFDGRLKTLFSTPEAVAEAVAGADLVIGTVLIPGASAPRLVRRDQLAGMKPGAVLVDVSIDQGGCFETSRPTTHDAPVFTVDGVIHYCVANMPGAAPLTSTLALCAATAPYVEALADRGLAALADDPGLAAGLNVEAGEVTHPAVARSLAA
jgi:alanine dehydrogenase